MVKPLTFKGDKKVKKRKRPVEDASDDPRFQSSTTSKSVRNKRETTPVDEVKDDDTWVSADAPSDISGPVIFVLPTEPVSCLACDFMGSVFTVKVEHLIEDDPTTAEPHDTRQVWVAGRIAGAEGFTLKGHHGQYLSCDAAGFLSASKEAAGPEEQWTVLRVPDSHNLFALQTVREKFVHVKDNPLRKGFVVRGDDDEITFDSSVRIRMQAQFKPRHKVLRDEQSQLKISRRELEDEVGRKLEDDEVKMLKRARREGNYREALLDIKVKGKHDKFA